MKKIFFTVSALGFLIFLGGCSYYPTQPQAKPAAKSAPAENKAVVNSITIQNFAFSPTELKVKAGATVTWINNDSAPHTIKSATFNSATLASGNKFEFKFDNIGTFDFSCGIHPSMKGKVIVE